MALGSGVQLELDHARIEFLPGAVEAARAGHQPGGLKNNREFISCAVEFRAAVPPEIEALLREWEPKTEIGDRAELVGLPAAISAASSAPALPRSTWRSSRASSAVTAALSTKTR